ncbi:MAG TPA: carboxypeptidase-like regulatory domain-containing protein [Candidatus Sulfotelmatobacter sp.]|nr:carboxypeptidase-like regulatory domain-containing protein [Candidatus Sulfotelmatobacter sp.]
MQSGPRTHPTLVFCLLLAAATTAAASGASWNGVLTDSAGKKLAGALVELRSSSGAPKYAATTDGDGSFRITGIPSGSYEVSATIADKTFKTVVAIQGDSSVALALQVSEANGELRVLSVGSQPAVQASGGEHLSGTEVSSLPLNVRDFSKLLLLAAGTMTDTNGAANFTQQFAVNGQRGSATVFGLDGFDTTDAEMGGATFSNFNVDGIQEVQSSSGVMPADIGHGAGGYTNVVTKSGTNQVHGSLFEFARNAAFDARNYFDHVEAGGRRIPPFVRNEFGFTNGGPVVIPHIYDGRSRTFYFGEYQGFRQVLGTTQVIPVPTADERNGIDTTTYPGDTLTIPVNPAVVPLLSAYPLPNEPAGAFGNRTYATSSKVVTTTYQFSIRVDHQISNKASLVTRFSLNQVTGPLTNPDQTVLNPSFGVQFFDHQRNGGVKYVRTISPHMTSETSLSFIRSTPFFPTPNHTQPGITFGDGLFQSFNQPGGSIFGSYGNLFQLKQDMSFTRGSHAFKWGVEIRVNRDSTIFGVNPNGLYEFGGGTSYCCGDGKTPIVITSASGTHNIQSGDKLPDSLTALLTATPYSYNIMAAANVTPTGDKFDEAGVRREAYNFYFEDAWKATRNLTVSYGLRYEVNSRIHEATKRTSSPIFLGADGKPTSYLDHTATQQVLLINPQPPYNQDWNGWGPRLALDYALSPHTVLHAGGAVTTLLPNLWQDNSLTAAMPFAFAPSIYSQAGFPVPFTDSFVPLTLPTAYNIQGQPIFATGRTQDVPANTVLDVARFQQDLETLTPGNVQLLNVFGMARNFGNGYIGSWTAGVDHDFGDFKFNASYVATAGIHLPRVFAPNGYGGAAPGFAPFTEFNAAGQPAAGFGPESIMSDGSHSSYHALQTSLTKNSARMGLGLQASYTYSKSLDDTSAVLAGLAGGSGTILQAVPQDPWNPGAEKGPSTFDVTHVFTVSVIELLPLDKVEFLRPLGQKVTRGWQFLNITTLTTGSPFTVFSGIQQTGAGNGGGDRPDLVSMPRFSTSRGVRDDYFGQGSNNAAFFSIPIDITGGTGPNSGRFGTMGRDTFRGPDFHDLDVALIKDTPFGHRANAEFGNLEFRAEFFNVFNIVNFGLPSNIVRGSGFGLISKTAGNSRQIQFSLKLIY